MRIDHLFLTYNQLFCELFLLIWVEGTECWRIADSFSFLFYYFLSSILIRFTIFLDLDDFRVWYYDVDILVLISFIFQDALSALQSQSLMHISTASFGDYLHIWIPIDLVTCPIQLRLVHVTIDLLYSYFIQRQASTLQSVTFISFCYFLAIRIKSYFLVSLFSLLFDKILVLHSSL